jgi:hypothetical protein
VSQATGQTDEVKAPNEAKTASAAERKGAKKSRGKAEKQAQQPFSDELYQGVVKLVIVSPVDADHMSKLEEILCKVPNLRLVLTGGSFEEGFGIVVSAEKPIPLLTILRAIPSVEQADKQVVKKEKVIQVKLKAREKP